MLRLGVNAVLPPLALLLGGDGVLLEDDAVLVLMLGGKAVLLLEGDGVLPLAGDDVLVPPLILLLEADAVLRDAFQLCWDHYCNQG